MDAYPRDLLQRFRSNHNHARQSEYTSPNEETEELELNLGLSLGGKFGVDKSPKKLFRSSSIAGAIHLVREEDKDNPAAPPFLTYPTLIRTSSLPTETEEEWRKRKELQSLRRMEAKRRRLEKQRSLRADREGGEDERLEIEGKSSFDSRDKQRFLVTDKAGSNGVLRVPPFRLNGWIEAAKQALIGGGIGVGIKVNCGDFGGCHEDHGGGSSNGGSAGLAVRSLQGSVESVRGDSAGMSESESKPIEDQGSGSCRGERGLNVNQHLQEQSNKLAVRSPSLSKDGNSGSVLRADTQIPSKTPKSLENEGTAALGMNKMTDMPSVFTRGDGPNGRRVEGILYKYGRGEEVRIMCICHGKFLSPAEFVKHAGGGDVANPRKHIFISANPVFSQ